MRVAACCWLMACCLGLAGCSLFGKKSATKPAPLPDAPNPGAAGTPAAGGFTPASHTLTSQGSGILAGKVLDSYDRKPPATFIQVVSASEANGAKSAPIEVAADEQGYFTIHGLQPGQHYELIARTRDGAAKLAGRVWATPPNPRLLIYMTGDFATSTTPAAPSIGVPPGEKKASPTNALPPQAGAEQAGSETNGDPASRLTAPQRPVDLGTPSRLNEDAGNSSGQGQPRAEIRPQDIVAAPNGFARRDIPAEIPPQAGPRPQGPFLQTPPASPALPNVATPVPSCVLAGRQLDNFALYDLNGQPWEYRNHRGKLVLLDFWGTWCGPCRATIPHLIILQQNYGLAGLEVIGIAYERVPGLPAQARVVQGVRDRMRINYRLLLGADNDDRKCPVRTQFGVQYFPTLVLLDENNRIIWKEEGAPDAYKLQDLTMTIQQHLRNR